MENNKNTDTKSEVKEEELDEVSGGVQAGSILKGGDGEFGPKPYVPPARPKAKPYL